MNAGLVIRRIVAVALAALVASCASTKGLAPQANGRDANRLEASRSFAGIPVADSAWPSADWWRRFNDPQLDALVNEALTGSPTMRAADARVRKAVAVAGIANAARLPQVTGNASATRVRIPDALPAPFGGSWVTPTALTANLSYDLDLWGRNRSAYESALDEAHAASVDRYAAQLFLSTSIVRAYVQLQRAHEQLDIAQALVADRERVRALTEQRTANGIDSRVELRQAEAALPEARERVIQLEETIALTRNQIAALVGAGPDRGLSIERPRLQSTGALSLPTTLPADLIGRRPDIVASRWRVEGARNDIAAAKADFYPNVNVMAFIGLQSLGLGSLLHAGSAFTGFGPALRLPIFEGGRLRSNLAVRDAQYDEAVERYNQAIADALREVVDQLASMKSIDAQRREVDAGLKTAQSGYDLALLRFKEGLGNYLQVLNAESQVLAQKSLQADLRAHELDVAVNLTRALGGGYEDKNNAPIVGASK